MAHESWPFLMRTLADLVGVEATMQIVDRFGGLSNVRIPASTATPHPWAELLDPDAWARVVAALGGQRVDVPRGAHLQLRKAAVLDLIEAEPDLSDGEVALRCGCTQRYVRSLRRASRAATADPRQLRMFGD